MICTAIALFVYFLLQTPFLPWTLHRLINILFSIHFSLLLNKSSFAPSATSLSIDFAVLVLCAYIWTSFRGSAKRIVASFLLAALLVPVTWYLYIGSGIFIISVLIVIGATLAIMLDAIVELLSNRANRKLVEGKQDAEFNILRHLNHNVKPAIQMSKSPITAVMSFLESKKLLDQPLARRLDGSLETVGEALNNALTSLTHINDILETARELVAHEIRREDFQDCDLCCLFREEIAPLYASKISITIECDRSIILKLHRNSFVEAMNNLIRNAEVHGFQGNCTEARLLFRITERRRSIVLDYINNGRLFPENLTENEFLSLGGKSVESPGEGLGGAWIGKVIASHNGSFEIIRDEHPLHFRMTLPKGGI